ncbi:MAG: inositol monophosphatase family protein [Candidatus Thermoplasmatota archaeon]|nr:inositol monophosphatase family protein [Candidatus Thermoplasmatota archaeon]
MLEQVEALVREVAQREVTPRFLKVTHSHKVDGSLFTEADAATQAALEAALPRIRDVPVLGEEMTERRQHEAWDAGRDGLWCVDPIDGTSNFVAGVPYFAVSVAYLYKGERQLGVVYDPVADEMFTAERGRGAHLNGTRLPLQPRFRVAIPRPLRRVAQGNRARGCASRPVRGDEGNRRHPARSRRTDSRHGLLDQVEKRMKGVASRCRARLLRTGLEHA